MLALEDYKSANKLEPTNTTALYKIGTYHFNIGSVYCFYCCCCLPCLCHCSVPDVLSFNTYCYNSLLVQFISRREKNTDVKCHFLASLDVTWTLASSGYINLKENRSADVNQESFYNTSALASVIADCRRE